MTYNKQEGWLHLLPALTSLLLFMKVWLTNEQEIENNSRNWRIREHPWK